jgi:excinuclease ABC subunit C
MIPTFIDRTKIPHKPGVYMYKDSSGKVIYVGKAIDLYHRVASYFNSKDQGTKTEQLVKNIADVETIIVESEIEALILEANLIKKFLPLYNIRLTDDKDYLYVKVTKETYPKIITARKQDLSDAKKYFGPFPSSRTVKTTLKRLRRVFPWCANPPKTVASDKSQDSSKSKSTSSTLATRHLNKPCFYFHIGQCPGPCAGVISPEDYNKTINRFIKFMDGRGIELKDELVKEMEAASSNLEFEQAQAIKRVVDGITYILQPNKTHMYLENPNFLEDQRMLALEEMQKHLMLPTLPERIECFDISNTVGQQATGSMVVLTNGEIDKSQYRKFKIQITGRPNDVGMHREMMRRRLKHKEWPLPDLMIIDGGRGQVRGVYEELQAAEVDIPVYGLAKRLEWLYHPEDQIVRLPKSALSLRLLQRIRDEAHRFAITFHRKLRSKDRFERGI